MDIETKLAILADAAKYDASCAASGGTRRSSSRAGGGKGGIGSHEGHGICHSYTPDGRCISLLKILLTNFCLYDCLYCINRRSSDVRRARFSVEEVVNLTLDFYRRNCIDGLFLSSGVIRNPDYTMEQLVRVARTLREKHDFRGYIHLKTIPDASPELLSQAGLWADRLSVNIELPTQSGLAALAPEKDASSIRHSMGRLRQSIDEARAERRAARTQPIRILPGTRARRAQPPSFAAGGQSTQMIVGADGASDAQILSTSAQLYGDYRLKRVYYSAFSPIPDAPSALPAQSPPLLREHRLYQADWLMRFYGFSAHEITPTDSGMLVLQVDPKLAWALAHPEHFPVDLNHAPRELLLRVPGLGVRTVQRLLAARRVRAIRADDLRALRVPTRRVLPFVILADHRPASDAAQHHGSAALTGLPPRHARAPVQGSLF
ncbi:MAG: putative DNA modification/repair radical SAM protein [Lautropia sp.]|nr:putative DNA modification/repair radical SAM protein [Lautropia sp.]